MQLFTSILQQSSASSSDSSFAFSEKAIPESFFSFDNPLVLSFLIIVLILVIVLLFYRFVIIPMNKRHMKEKQNLKFEHAQLMAMFAELDPDPVFRFDTEGKIIMANKAGAELAGINYVVGKKISAVLPELQDFDLVTCIRNGKQLTFTSRIKYKYYQFTLTGIPEMDIAQIYGSDISKLKVTEENLKGALKRIEDSDRLKSYFLSQISHEVRSPLTAIIGFASLIKEELSDDMSPSLKSAFLSIENSSKRLKRTIDQIINMSQLQLGNYDLKFENINLENILRELRSEYQSFAKEKNIDLNLEILVKDTKLFADRYSLIQIFNNLIDNAIKYTNKGGVTITVNRDVNNRLSVFIKDTGIGMSKEYLSKVFTPFSQEIMGYNRPYDGTGLGLALTKKFVEVNKGEIFVSSIKDEGSTVTVIFSN